jgi:cytochrome c553
MKCARSTRMLVFSFLFVLAEMPMLAQGIGQDSGARQYVVTCAGCHAADGSGSVKGAAIATLPKVIALSDDDLIRIVRDGVPGRGMPGAKQLGDEKIQAIVRYLRALQSTSGATTAANPSAANSIAAKASGNANAVAPAETDAVPKQPMKVTAAKAVEPVSSGVNQIDVQQSQLNQKEVRENWVSYNGDYTGRRFSSMAEVTLENVRNLKSAWDFHTSNAGVMEVTPIVVAGVMFITRSNDAYALDAKTGKQLWHHARAVSEGLIDDASGHINRGVAVLGTRVYMETDNAHLLCLDARSGEMIWDVAYATGNNNYGATSAPLIVKDKVLVGTSGGDDGVAWVCGCLRCADRQGGLAVLDNPRARRAWIAELAGRHVSAWRRDNVDAGHL